MANLFELPYNFALRKGDVVLSINGVNISEELENIKDNELKTSIRSLDKKIKQSIDLAKLSQNNLTGKDLTEFINRSIDLIK